MSSAVNSICSLQPQLIVRLGPIELVNCLIEEGTESGISRDL
jgi:hypothetical protein